MSTFRCDPLCPRTPLHAPLSPHNVPPHLLAAWRRSRRSTRVATSGGRRSGWRGTTPPTGLSPPRATSRRSASFSRTSEMPDGWGGSESHLVGGGALAPFPTPKHTLSTPTHPPPPPLRLEGTRTSGGTMSRAWWRRRRTCSRSPQSPRGSHAPSAQRERLACFSGREGAAGFARCEAMGRPPPPASRAPPPTSPATRSL
eukprot:scaffold116105_cov36-Phaeocystis_antarctica.AAC.1